MKNALAAVLCTCTLFGVSNALAESELAPAAPFGIEMGSPGSCEALPRALRSIDPDVKKEPPGPGIPDDPSVAAYTPLDKVFPGALPRLMSMCIEGKLNVVTWSVRRGPGGSTLLEVFDGLTAKHRLMDLGQSIDIVLKSGGKIYFQARQSSITINASKDSDSFSLF